MNRFSPALIFALVCMPLSLLAEPDETRPATSDADLRYWLENMVWQHHFTLEEIKTVTGLSIDEIKAAQEQLKITDETRPDSIKAGTVRMMPYPGGRHPRIGFLEGAIRPQRETKVSVFLPWGDGSDYVVADTPEAIWSNLGLTYLAHTHVETIWTKEGVQLPRMEWERKNDGSLHLDRTLPNGIRYEADVHLVNDHLEMEMRLTNGTDQPLSDLRVQNCIMLKGAPEFEELTNDNKVFESPFAAVHAKDHPNRWIITAWEPCHRPWGNVKVPCLHSDPRFPDCEPGDTQTVRGWLSFYEGDDLKKEFLRIGNEYFGNSESSADQKKAIP